MSFKSLKGTVAVGLIVATLLLAVPADMAASEWEIQTRTELQTIRIEARSGLAGILNWLWSAVLHLTPRSGAKLDPNG